MKARMSEQTAVDEEVSIVWDEDGQGMLTWEYLLVYDG